MTLHVRRRRTLAYDSAALRVLGFFVRQATQVGELQPLGCADVRWCSWKVERVMGIEPTLAAWEAAVLPLNYTRLARRILGCGGRTGQMHFLLSRP